MNEESKDVKIGEHTYIIGRLDAVTGSWIVALLLTKMLPMGMENQEGMEALAAQERPRSSMTEQEFRNIQHHCIKVCKRYQEEDGVALDILRRDGRQNFPDLQYDIKTYVGLTVHTLLFNILPLFSSGMMEDLEKELPTTPIRMPKSSTSFKTA